MKIIYLTAVLFLISKSISAQIEDPNVIDREPQNMIKGNVMRLTGTTWSAVSRFGEFVKTRLIGEGTVHFKAGNFIDSTVYFSKNNHDIIKEEGYFKCYYKLIGKLNKVVKTIGYEVRRRESENYKDEKDLDVNVYKYDYKGNIIEKMTYMNDTLFAKEVAAYNRINKLLTYKKYGADGLIEYEVSNKYDAKGNIIEVVSYRKWQDYRMEKKKYNAQNKILQSVFYNIDNSPSYEISYKYDATGKLTEEITTYYTNPSFNKRILHRHNASTRQYEKIEYNSAGEPKLIKSEIYDEKNRVIAIINSYEKTTYEYNQSGQLFEKNSYYYGSNKKGERKIDRISKKEYSYDLHGNWIKEVSSETNSKEDEDLMIPKYYKITERFIQYR